MKIVADKHIPFLEGVFEPYAEVVYIDGRSISHEDIIDADALIIRSRTRCDSALLDGTSVSMIATAAIGMDHIDIEYCRRHDIEVINAQGCNAGGVMQYVFSALYGVAARKFIKLTDYTFGIIGVGDVGKKVESLARYLGFKVLLCDPPRAEAEGPEGFCSLDHLLANSQIVTLHVPLDDTTRGMAGEEFFTAMQPGAIFINTSRGEVVNDEALMMAIPKLGAVVIDTWNHEPDVNEKLYDFQPAPDGDHSPIVLDLKGKNQGEVTAVFQYNYPIFTDDFRFRMEPHKFEKLRIDYKYRREIIVE